MNGTDKDNIAGPIHWTMHHSGRFSRSGFLLRRFAIDANGKLLCECFIAFELRACTAITPTLVPRKTNIMQNSNK